MDYFQHELASMGVREDAKYSAVLEKKLDYVKKKVYDTIYPQLMGRQLIPVSNEAPEGAESITYEQLDQFGAAQMIANYADDLSLIEVLKDDVTVKVKGFGAAYQYSVIDLKRAAMAGTNLNTNKATATRRAFEIKVEDFAAQGLASHGMTGLANNPNVTLVTPTTGSFAGATAAQIGADLDKLCLAVANATKNMFPPRTIATSIPLYNILATKVVSTTGDTNRTILQDYIARSPWVKEIVPWDKLGTADAAGTGPRIVAYTKDPEILSLEIPLDYEQLPPQAKNLAFVVNTHGRCAGVLIPIPIAIGYMDGC